MANDLVELIGGPMDGEFKVDAGMEFVTMVNEFRDNICAVGPAEPPPTMPRWWFHVYRRVAGGYMVYRGMEER